MEMNKRSFLVGVVIITSCVSVFCLFVLVLGCVCVCVIMNGGRRVVWFGFGFGSNGTVSF